MLDMVSWDKKQVQRWLQGLGMQQYVEDFTWHNITGASLCEIDLADLEEIGVRSTGHRIQLLRAINIHLKRAEDYGLSRKSIAELTVLVGQLECKLKKVTESHNKLRQDMLPAIRRAKEQTPLPLPLANSSPTHVKSRTSPIADAFVELRERNSSRHAQSPALPPLIQGQSQSQPPPSQSATQSAATTPLLERIPQNRLGFIDEDESTSSLLTPREPPLLNGPQVVHANVKSGTPISLSTASEPFKSFRVTLDDPCTKVLPAVLRRYRILDDPQNYCLLVCFGDKERELRADEKPLLVFKELQDAGQRPVFMVRQIVKSNAALTPSSRSTPGGMI